MARRSSYTGTSMGRGKGSIKPGGLQSVTHLGIKGMKNPVTLKSRSGKNTPRSGNAIPKQTVRGHFDSLRLDLSKRYGGVQGKAGLVSSTKKRAPR